MYRNKLDEIEQKLQKAYEILLKSEELEGEEARGYIAEVLEMLKERV